MSCVVSEQPLLTIEFRSQSAGETMRRTTRAYARRVTTRRPGVSVRGGFCHEGGRGSESLRHVKSNRPSSHSVCGREIKQGGDS